MEDQRLLVQRSRAARALGFPRGHVRIIGIVAQSLALGRLVLLAEMRTTGFVAVERISAHQFASSKKSAKRPAFSRDWLNSSFEPSTRTFLQKSSRSSAIMPAAFFKPAALRDMPQYSHKILPNSRW